MSNLPGKTAIELYALRRRVDLLRQQVYYPLDEQPTEVLLHELRAAESELFGKEAKLTRPTDRGMLIDNRDEETTAGGQLMGPDTTGLEVVAQLR